MKVKAKGICPICKNSGKCIAFKIRAEQYAELTFWCGICKLKFKANALGYKIGKENVEFFKIISSEIFWENRDFNPSER